MCRNNQYLHNCKKICTNCGIKTEYNKETPFIDNLIYKRTNNCKLGASSHIAALIPTTFTEWSFINNTSSLRIVIGENSNKPLYSNDKIRTHAEMEVIQKAGWLIRCKKIKNNKMNLIVIRINKLGELCESAPCSHCTKELSINKNISINKLYFSRSDGSITCIKFNDWIKSGTSHISKGWKWLQRSNKN